MTCTVIDITRLLPSADAVVHTPATLTPTERRDLEWDLSAGRTLRQYAWLWPDVIPLWVVEAWADWADARRKDALSDDPADTDWRALWLAFVEAGLSTRPEWRAAVEESLRGVEG